MAEATTPVITEECLVDPVSPLTIVVDATAAPPAIASSSLPTHEPFSSVTDNAAIKEEQPCDAATFVSVLVASVSSPVEAAAPPPPVDPLHSSITQPHPQPQQPDTHITESEHSSETQHIKQEEHQLEQREYEASTHSPDVSSVPASSDSVSVASVVINIDCQPEPNGKEDQPHDHPIEPTVPIYTITVHNAPALVGVAHARPAPATVTDVTRIVTAVTALIPTNQTRPKSKPTHTHASVPYLRLLPFEVQSHMVTFLDARALCNLAGADKYSQSLAYQRSAWAHLLEQPWNGHSLAPRGDSIKGVSRIQQPREYYGLRYEAAVARRIQNIKQYEKKLVEVNRNNRGCCCAWMTDVFIYPVIAILFILFVGLLVSQLSKGDPVDYLTFWPLLLIGLLVTLIGSTVCCKRWFARGEDGCLPGNFFDKSQSFWKWLMEELGEGESRRAHFSGCVGSLALFAWLILLSLKVCGYINIHWSLVFLPLYFLALLGCCAPCLEWTPDEDYDGEWTGRLRPCVIIWVAIALPVLAFVILLNIRLVDDSTMGVTIVVIPLFLFDLITLLTTLFVSKHDKDLCIILMWILLDLPLVIFKILLAIKIDRARDDIAFEIVFIPLYLTLFIILVVGIGMCYGTANKMEVYRTQAPTPPNEPIPDV